MSSIRPCMRGMVWADGAAAIGTATRVSRLARGDDVRKSQIYATLRLETGPGRHGI